MKGTERTIYNIVYNHHRLYHGSKFLYILCIDLTLHNNIMIKKIYHTYYCCIYHKTFFSNHDVTEVPSKRHFKLIVG